MLLLDSQAALWLVEDGPRLGPRTQRLIEDAAVVHVSAATVWELSIKNVSGKLELPDDLVAALARQGLVLLPVTPEQAESIRTLPDVLRRHDPFDRLLVAQARDLNLTLVTADRVLLALDLPYIVDARD